MPKQYQHIFFDLDHTLWDFDKNSGIVLRTLYDDYKLADRGISKFEDFYNVYTEINEKLWERFRKGHIKRSELRTKRFRRALLEFKIGDEALSDNLSHKYLELLPIQTELTAHSLEVLEYCNEKYELHLITNGFEKTQKMKLENSGIMHFFKEVITSERSQSMKPHPTIFEYAMQTTGALADNSIMIGDHLEVDILGAEQMGWDQVYYNPARKEHKGNPTHEIHSLKDLLQIL